MLNNSLYSSDKEDWETPQHIFDKLNKEFDFLLDVCANDSNAKVMCYYRKDDNGLKKEWYSHNWMNPPYGREISKWVEKAYNEFIKGRLTVCLLPVRSDTKWWHNYVMKSTEIRLLNKRLSFGDSKNKAPFPACIVIFDPDNKEEYIKLSVFEV